MLPLRDDNPTYTTPYVTYALIALNVAAFLFELSLGPQLPRFFQHYAVVPRLLGHDLRMLEAGHGDAIAGLLPLLSSMFLHGGWMHLGGNMLFLWIFGDNVEERLTHGGYLAFYLLAGVAASLAQVWSEPMSSLPSLGASGAIGGVLGAYLVLYPRARVTTLVFLGFLITTLNVPALFFLGIWFVLQSVHGLAALGASTAQSGGTAFWAHIGGFLAGAVVGLIAKALPEPAPARNRFADRWYSNR